MELISVRPASSIVGAESRRGVDLMSSCGVKTEVLSHRYNVALIAYRCSRGQMQTAFRVAKLHKIPVYSFSELVCVFSLTQMNCIFVFKVYAWRQM